jgi:hypothetical protein
VSPDDLNVTLSAGWVAVFLMTAAVPGILWAISIQRHIRELLDMHRDPDRSAATAAQHKLVKELYESTAQLHANNTRVIRENTHAIHQLTHYIRWWTRDTTGRDLPPELPGETQL